MLAMPLRLRSCRDQIWICLIAVLCLLRSLPRVFTGGPRTPLRMLAIVTFDMLHRHRTGKWLSRVRCDQMAALLDFGACANAHFDRKKNRQSEWEDTLRLLEESGVGLHADHYLRRLTELETGRPRPWGSEEHFQKVRVYREAVIRLSIAMAATTANGNRRIAEAIEATHQHGVLNLLFRIVMQCQIIDDFLDYRQDASAGLPSFLTACQSLPRSLELTRQASLEYADDRAIAATPERIPLRMALRPISFLARLALLIRRLRARAVLKTAQEPA